MSRKGQTCPRTITIGLRQRAWWVMRKRITFTARELLATLANGTEKDAPGNLGKYLRALEKAGIIKREAVREPAASLTSNGCLRYRLAINDGRRAPVWRVNANTVYDPNSDTVYPLVACHD